MSDMAIFQQLRNQNCLWDSPGSEITLDHSLVKLKAMSEICVSLTAQDLLPCSEGFDDLQAGFPGTAQDYKSKYK